MNPGPGHPDARGVHALVRDLHDEAARDPDLGVASVRPLGTTRFELRLIGRDVLRKLDLQPEDSVLEIGCGVGVVGLPLARRARHYVGVDLAETALGVFGRRLAGAGIDAHAELRKLDFVAASEQAVEALGSFHRVVAYSVLHYVGDDDEGQALVTRALAALKPGGRALFGNLPLTELADEVRWREELPPLARKFATIGAAVGRGSANAVGVVQPRHARLAGLAFAGARSWLRPIVRGARVAPAALPSASTMKLSRHAVEEWLEKAPVSVHYRWLAPGTATPLASGRADLLVIRDA